MAATEVTFSPERSLEAVLFVASRLAKPAIHEVLKLLYFADKIHLSKYGWLASGDDYVAMCFGPVGSGAYNLLKAARGDDSGWIHPDFYRLVRGALEIADDKRSIRLLRSFDPSHLSPAYAGCLGDALKSYAGMSFGDRTELSQDAAWRAAWDLAAEDEVGQSPMQVETIARTLSNSEEVVAQLNNQQLCMNFGSGFPDDVRLAQIRRRLKPGVVIKLFRRMDDGWLHEKRFVVLHVDAHTTTCVIN